MQKFFKVAIRLLFLVFLGYFIYLSLKEIIPFEIGIIIYAVLYVGARGIAEWLTNI